MDFKQIRPYQVSRYLYTLPDGLEEKLQNILLYYQKTDKLNRTIALIHQSYLDVGYVRPFSVRGKQITGPDDVLELLNQERKLK